MPSTMRQRRSRTRGLGGTPTPTPAPSTVIGILGDSQSAPGPNSQNLDIAVGAVNGRYYGILKNNNSAIPVRFTGQNGRNVGLTTDTSTDNSHWGHIAEIEAWNSNLYTLFDGPNNYSAGNTIAASALIDRWKGLATRLRQGGKKLGVFTVPPVPLGTTSFAAGPYNTWRDQVNALIYSRQAEFADFIIPIGDHKDFGTSAAPNDASFIDPTNIHISQGGQDSIVSPVFQAVMQPILAGSVATSPTAGAWLGADVINAATAAVITRSYLVTGLAMGTTANASITGGTFAIGNGVQGTSVRPVRNGDLVTVNATSASALSTQTTVTLTIGANSHALKITTTAATPATTTWSPTQKFPGMTLSNGNLTAAGPSSGGAFAAVRTSAPIVGKKYLEITFNTLSPNANMFGLAASTVDMTQNLVTRPNSATTGGYVYGGTDQYSFNVSAEKLPGGLFSHVWSNKITAGETFGVAIDQAAGKLYVRRGASWMNSDPGWDGGTNLPVGDPANGIGGFILNLDAWYVWLCFQNEGSATINCGQAPFVGAIPAGFVAAG